MSLSRRSFISSAAVGAALMASPFLRAALPSGKKPMNVLFLISDDLNDWIGCMGGHPHARTPNLDSLAQRGTLFNHAYCASPACVPSRASTLCGISPSTSGLVANIGRNIRDWPVLTNATTLPQYFMNNGYRVTGTGKIFHDNPDRASFEEYWPRWEQQVPQSSGPPKGTKPLNGIPDTKNFDWGPIDAKDEHMGEFQQAAWVCKQLEQPHEQPFFLSCGFHLPHLPWYAPRKYFDLHPLEELELPQVKEDDLEDVPQPGKSMARVAQHQKVVSQDQWKKAVQAYLACISLVDAAVGRIIDTLDKSGHADNTVIVFWSDHGWHLGEKLHWSKFALWEEATRNPMIMVVPGVTKPNSVCPRTVSLLDIYPTLVDVCGLPPRKEVEGASLKPLLANPMAAWDRPAVTSFQGHHTVRSERWRYIRYLDGSEELYDHETDDLEWTNLANDPTYADAKAELARWVPADTNPPKPPRESKTAGTQQSKGDD